MSHGNQLDVVGLLSDYRTGKLVKKIDSSFLDQSKPGTDTAISAIIEIDVPTPKATVEYRREGFGGRSSTVRLKSVAPVTGVAAQMEEAAHLIAQISHHQPVALASAGSFVADLTTAQARQLADSPLVRKIYGNLPLR